MASGETKGVMVNDSASSFDAAAISVSLTAFIVAYFVLSHVLAPPSLSSP
ncbi:hypothetical protein [Vibrio caribbeanicus]|nr:hypothetical protein [Vibrio caribbeanicus]MCY9846292.1 hypothetical protein [Vibrio caribbeanicus]